MAGIIDSRWELFIKQPNMDNLDPTTKATLKSVYYAGAYATVTAMMMEAMRANIEETNMSPTFIMDLLKEASLFTPEPKTH